MFRSIALAVIAAAAGLVMLVTPTAHAQYGPIGYYITCSSSSTTVAPQGVIAISCQLFTGNGVPVPGASLTFTITVGPESAYVGSRSVTRITDANGQAFVDLHVGDQPGATIVLTIVADGGIAATQSVVYTSGQQAVIPVTSLRQYTSPGKLVAPTTGASSIVPPNTGDAGLASGSNAGSDSLAVMAAAILLASIFGFGIARKLQSR